MGRRKVEMKRIENKQYRNQCFSKRRKGLFRYALNFSKEFNLNLELVVLSEAGRTYNFSSSSSSSSSSHSDSVVAMPHNSSPPLPTSPVSVLMEEGSKEEESIVADCSLISTTFKEHEMMNGVSNSYLGNLIGEELEWEVVEVSPLFITSSLPLPLQLPPPSNQEDIFNCLSEPADIGEFLNQPNGMQHPPSIASLGSHGQDYSVSDVIEGLEAEQGGGLFSLASEPLLLLSEDICDFNDGELNMDEFFLQLNRLSETSSIDSCEAHGQNSFICNVADELGGEQGGEVPVLSSPTEPITPLSDDLFEFSDSELDIRHFVLDLTGVPTGVAASHCQDCSSSGLAMTQINDSDGDASIDNDLLIPNEMVFDLVHKDFLFY